jgi:hypothetical protein
MQRCDSRIGSRFQNTFHWWYWQTSSEPLIVISDLAFGPPIGNNCQHVQNHVCIVQHYRFGWSGDGSRQAARNYIW